MYQTLHNWSQLVKIWEQYDETSLVLIVKQWPNFERNANLIKEVQNKLSQDSKI